MREIRCVDREGSSLLHDMNEEVNNFCYSQVMLLIADSLWVMEVEANCRHLCSLVWPEDQVGEAYFFEGL